MTQINTNAVVLPEADGENAIGSLSQMMSWNVDPISQYIVSCKTGMFWYIGVEEEGWSTLDSETNCLFVFRKFELKTI